MTKKALSDDAQAALTYHRIIEAFKYSYAWRSKLGDPDFSSTDTSNYTDINTVSDWKCVIAFAMLPGLINVQRPTDDEID